MHNLRGFSTLSNLATYPTRGTGRSAGYDFYLPKDVTIEPNERTVVFTHVTSYMQEDEWLDLRIRSSLAKKGLILVNGCGVIDSDYYPNDIGFMLMNVSSEPITLYSKDRIGQGIFTKYLRADIDKSLNPDRVGGFGSTGDK